MKQVWKCDFCSQTNDDPVKLKKHEENCSFNPIFRTCWSCVHHVTDYDSMTCDKGVKGYWNYEDDGDCPEWETDDEKYLRYLKIKSIKDKI